MKNEFDLQAFLLGEIYPQMDGDDLGNWNLKAAEVLADDLQQDGIIADAQEIYETIAEFIRQDAEDMPL